MLIWRIWDLLEKPTPIRTVVKKERDRERQRETERDRERQRERDKASLSLSPRPTLSFLQAYLVVPVWISVA
jgi:hypothetical protein